MNLRILAHARERMAERGITEVDIDAALSHHHTKSATPQNSILYVGRAPDGRELKVWTYPPGLSVDPVTVKSVAWKE